MLKRRPLNNVVSLLSRHSVALISLVVAVLALSLNTERSNRSEEQRTIRDASFRVLSELSQLQLLVDQSHYSDSSGAHQAIQGWARVNYMRDLSMVIPQPVPDSLDVLFQAWQQQVNHLGVREDSAAVSLSLKANEALTNDINHARASVKLVLTRLD